ncbi:acyl-CoA dehydrogenase family protein [Pseudomonas sp. NPDC086251]|uniref:acyl-CoA dehydrogenase family protein n=1 Tax=Pseudomonas sp. NPDC086251 TaxID=3364431 RepID=UPI003835221D
MSLLNTPALLAFRKEVRTFIRDNLPAELAEETRNSLHVPRASSARWQAILDCRGWGAANWPLQFGGTGWDFARRYIFEEECALADAPPLSVFGLYMIGPTLMEFGSLAQQQRYLPPLVNGTEYWCQGYSEPNAGSDLASLKTTALRDGSEWVVNGSKTWLSYGHEADFMILLARTDTSVKPQAGLSLFIVDMRTPGIDMYPIHTLEEGHSVNAVFFDNVRLPGDALIGLEGQGWTYGKYLLAHERTNNAQAPRTKRDLLALCDLAGERRGTDGKPMDQDPRIARRLASLCVDYMALQSAVLQALADQALGKAPGPEVSTLKIRGSELQQRITETAMQILGTEGLVLSPGYGSGAADITAKGWVDRHLFRRVVTIYAGANEVQKNIIAKSILGM